MDFLSRQSIDGESEQANHQRNTGLGDTLKSDHSSTHDFPKQGIFVERTLALVKPDAINKAGKIETILLKHGFTVLQVCLECSLLFSIVSIGIRNDVSCYQLNNVQIFIVNIMEKSFFQVLWHL